MIAYPDTSFLCALFRSQDNSVQAIACRASMGEPLHATSLLEFEFLQSVHLQVCLHTADRTKGFGPAEAGRMVAKWKAGIATGDVKLVRYDVEAVHLYARSLSVQYTATGGHRTLDVLHVATAVHLGAKRFLTFDVRQRKLAKAVGLKISP